MRRADRLDIGDDTINLPAGVQVRDVEVRSSDGGEFDPASTTVQANDIVRFRTRDARTHVIAFDEASLPAGARDRFAERSQLRSPPLLVAGAEWIVSLQDLPPGDYPFRCLQHGTIGRITIP